MSAGTITYLSWREERHLTASWHGLTTPLFSNFLFTNLFSIKFLYFFIISSLFPYFNLFVSIFIQSYANIKLHVSTLLDTNNYTINCLCGYFNENAEHCLLHCNRFTFSGIIMLFEINKLNVIGIPVNIDLLLFGNETLSCDINCSICLAVQKCIKNNCRFSMSWS